MIYMQSNIEYAAGNAGSEPDAMSSLRTALIFPRIRGGKKYQGKMTTSPGSQMASDFKLPSVEIAPGCHSLYKRITEGNFDVGVANFHGVSE